MRNISFKQIIILVILFFFFFGDFFNLKKKLNDFLKSFYNFLFKKNRKKGI